VAPHHTSGAVTLRQTAHTIVLLAGSIDTRTGITARDHAGCTVSNDTRAPARSLSKHAYSAKGIGKSDNTCAGIRFAAVVTKDAGVIGRIGQPQHAIVLFALARNRDRVLGSADDRPCQLAGADDGLGCLGIGPDGLAGGRTSINPRSRVGRRD
jgi:hypothetical protein